MHINPKVVDIYHLNANNAHGGDGADFHACYAVGFRGVIHKASQGTHLPDRLYAERKAKAQAAGLKWGAYHFNSGDSVALQAKYFLERAQPDAATEMCLDWEDNPRRAGGMMTLAAAREFLDRIDQAIGRTASLYSGNVVKEWAPHMSDGDREFFARHKLWLCQYAGAPALTDYNRHPLPWAKAWLWQYTGDGVGPLPHNVPGIGRNIDINHYAGSDDEFAAQWAG
jgi:lysozyme